MRESPSQEKLAADSAGPAPEPELETPPEQVLREVAPAPAHTEIDRLVADMQPLAQPATVDNAWLSQLGPFDAQQALALAASARDALAQIRANTTALQNGVSNPFIQYWRARLSQTCVREIGQFGSRSHGLALATSRRSNRALKAISRRGQGGKRTNRQNKRTKQKDTTSD